MGASLLAALILLTAGGTAVAGTDPTDSKPPKPSSLAPHPTAKRTFGAPIQPAIVHKRHGHAKPAPKGTSTRTPGQEASPPHSTAPGAAPK